MITLGLDTSSDYIAIAIVDDGFVISEHFILNKRTHLKSLLPIIDSNLRSCDLSINNIDLIVVVLGPGSWSGIRIGVTTAKAIAQSLDKPIIGVCSLDALAANLKFSCNNVYTLIDAARHQVYYGRYDCSQYLPRKLDDHKIIKTDDIASLVLPNSVIIGDGLSRYSSEMRILDRTVALAPNNINFIRPISVVDIGIAKYREFGQDDYLSLAPLYMQSANVQEQ